MVGLSRINSNLEDQNFRVVQSLVGGAKLFVSRMGAGEPVSLKTRRTRREDRGMQNVRSNQKIGSKEMRRCSNRRSRTAPIRTSRSLRTRFGRISWTICGAPRSLPLQLADASPRNEAVVMPSMDRYALHMHRGAAPHRDARWASGRPLWGKLRRAGARYPNRRRVSRR
jgi:hypothetical protein